MPDGTGQTCLLRPMVAKGKNGRKRKELTDGSNSKDNNKQQVTQPKNKGGAPKKRVKRELIIRIRMTATERFYIDSKAKAAGMRSSSWIRAAAKSAKVVPRLTDDERRILWMLAELGQ
jgi:hypothetical protein